MDFEIKSIGVGNGTNRYLVFGSGSRPFVMIPGLSINSPLDSAGAVAKAYSAFARDYRVILIDRRDEPEEGCDIASLSEDVRAVMDAENARGAYVFGVSQGGMIAQELAVAHPGYVSRLALASTLSAVNETAERVITNWATLASEGRTEELTLDFIGKVYSEGFAGRYGRFLAEMNKKLKRSQLDRFVRLALAGKDFDVSERLKEIKCPCLVLAGENDAVTTAAAAEKTACLLGCRCVILPGYCHAVYDEAPEFKDILLSFGREGDMECDTTL